MSSRRKRNGILMRHLSLVSWEKKVSIVFILTLFKDVDLVPYSFFSYIFLCPSIRGLLCLPIQIFVTYLVEFLVSVLYFLLLHSVFFWINFYLFLLCSVGYHQYVIILITLSVSFLLLWWSTIYYYHFQFHFLAERKFIT